MPISHHRIRSQLEKICATEEFQRSKRSRRFLNYIVEETLAGRSGRIKAYSVAISVLNRDETFDPQTDPMVRIEASQLRRRLERYYLTQGANDPVIIDLPKGGYVPVFSTAKHAVPTLTVPPPGDGLTAHRISASALGAALGVVALIAMAIIWAMTPTWTPFARLIPTASSAAGSNPTIRVLPFSATTTDDRSVAVAAGLADEVTQVLTRHGTLGVLAPPDRSGGVSLNHTDMILTGSVRVNAGVIRMTASLVDTRMGAYVWTETYDRPAIEPVLTLQTGLAADLGSHLAAPSGVVARILSQTAPTGAKPGNVR
jgi:TolB-like protein